MTSGATPRRLAISRSIGRLGRLSAIRGADREQPSSRAMVPSVQPLRRSAARITIRRSGSAASTEQDDEARLADFQALITAALEQRDQRLASWLRTELDLVRDRLEERWPQLIRQHPSAKGGAA